MSGGRRANNSFRCVIMLIGTRTRTLILFVTLIPTLTLTMFLTLTLTHLRAGPAALVSTTSKRKVECVRGRVRDTTKFECVTVTMGVN